VVDGLYLCIFDEWHNLLKYIFSFIAGADILIKAIEERRDLYVSQHLLFIPCRSCLYSWLGPDWGYDG
jgi:hypothetical protein